LPDIDASDGCTVQRIRFSDSSGNHRVIFNKVLNGGHSWPGGDKRYLVLSWGDIGRTNGDINASAEIWNFLKTKELSQPTTEVSLSQCLIEMSLFQNYPNPFNPSTEIGYGVPGTEYVTLKVYDLLGREVATLVNERKAPGSYSVSFDASGLASGVYFYRLEAGNFMQTKKLIVLR
jgi:hypothetical protein